LYCRKTQNLEIMKKSIVFILFAVLLISCESDCKWDQRNRKLVLNGRLVKTNNRVNDWIFYWTKSEAESKVGCKNTTQYENPYMVSRDYCIPIIGKKWEKRTEKDIGLWMTSGYADVCQSNLINSGILFVSNRKTIIN